MSPAWRLLGPLETASGMLLFGVSTAMIFAVIQRLFEAKYVDTWEYDPDVAANAAAPLSKVAFRKTTRYSRIY
jgi:hypothetical protein